MFLVSNKYVRTVYIFWAFHSQNPTQINVARLIPNWNRSQTEYQIDRICILRVEWTKIDSNESQWKQQKSANERENAIHASDLHLICGYQPR